MSSIPVEDLIVIIECPGCGQKLMLADEDRAILHVAVCTDPHGTAELIRKAASHDKA